jgi:hypothetical protein
MRFVAATSLAALVCAALASTACGNGGLFKQYEYEEDVYLALDGSATVYVNSSLAALDALRGATFDTDPAARFRRDQVQAFFTTPVTHVVSVSDSRRDNRRFAHVRVEVRDVRRLSEAAPFAWSSYRFALENGRFVYRQDVRDPVGLPVKTVPGVNWTGSEIVAFRLHPPSDVGNEHNAGDANHLRGNILVWEQPLADRLRGRPLAMVASMETQSILSHTLQLFGATALAVVITFGSVVWWIMRRGAKPARA